MKQNVKIGARAEAIFCILYLIFDFTAALIFFLNTPKSAVFTLWGWLSLILGSGDAFHLVPRVLITFFGDSSKLRWYSELGLLVSSITMTLFYLILFEIWKELFPDVSYPGILSWLIWISAGLRILLCLFPQNRWFSGGSERWGIYRNLPFVVTGICMIILFVLSGSWQMALAITVSFACYIPVVLFSKKKPAVGMLMIPKTLAYVWMISLGLSLIPKL